jgi:hypothetical protein
MRSIVLASLLLAASAGNLAAQDAGLSPPRTPDAERRYASDFQRPGAERLYASEFERQGEHLDVDRFQGSFDLGAQPQKPFDGVRVHSPTRSIERMKFVSVDDARDFAGHHVDTEHGPTLVEQRGDQVVIVRDPQLRENPRLVECYRKLLWKDLPAPSGPTDAVGFFDHEKGDVAATASAGPTFDKLRSMHDRLRARSANEPGVAPNDDGSYSVRLKSGYTARVAPDSTWATKDPARADMMAHMLSALRPPTAAATGSAVKGASSVIDGIGR